MAGRLVRFGLTGALVTAVHTLIVVAGVESGIVRPALANGVAFCCATLLSYWINTRWSFGAVLRGATALRFLLVSLIGLCLAVAVAAAIDKAGFDYLLGIVAIVIAVPLVTFCMHNFWTYR